MTKITIQKVLNKQEISKKSGKPYSRCSILTLDKNGNDLWLSGFGNNTTESWRDGQSVDLEVYKEEYNGKEYWKFKTPTEVSTVDLMSQILAKLDVLISIMSNHTQPTPNASQGGKFEEIKASPLDSETAKVLADKLGAELPQKEEINPADIPF